MFNFFCTCMSRIRLCTFIKNHMIIPHKYEWRKNIIKYAGLLSLLTTNTCLYSFKFQTKILCVVKVFLFLPTNLHFNFEASSCVYSIFISNSSSKTLEKYVNENLNVLWWLFPFDILFLSKHWSVSQELQRQNTF